MPRSVARYGWIPDIPDARDVRFVTPRAVGSPPARVDLRPVCPAVCDQGDLGSATAAAVAAAVEFAHHETGHRPFAPSLLSIYYGARVRGNTVETDAGAMLRDALSAVRREAVCAEADWPYDISRFAIRPPEGYGSGGGPRLVASYGRLGRELAAFRACLAGGRPFLFGFTAYASFESEQVAATGVVPMPAREEEVAGSHAVVAVGYDDEHEVLLVRNSWGTRWGLRGYCTLPYGYLLDEDLTDDFWAVRTESKNP